MTSPSVPPSDNQVEDNTEKEEASTDDVSEQDKALIAVPQWDPEQNHGRYAADDYAGCQTIEIPFQNPLLKKGKCPDCNKYNTEAKLYAEKPTVIIFLESQPLITGKQYALEKARCAVCKSYFTAELPVELKERPKYSHDCVTTLSITHYYAGLPFKRIETLQQLQHVPLADATQYDLVNKFYVSTVSHVVGAMRQYAAEGNSFFFDDTPGRIIEQTIKNKNTVTAGNKRGIHTTALLSEHEGHRIYLFDTNTSIAGKQFSTLIEERHSDGTFTTMSDASAHNFPLLADNLLARWVITLCLSHGRRRFHELLEGEDEDIQLILDIIASVYQNEKHCKNKKLNDQDRLLYHQTHSGPLMKALHTWLNNLMLYNKVEPNSRLGEAITYMLKRWCWLTQFLRVPGAKLDNNICEQAIKVVIRYRNNSLFYKTFYGANIGDAMMSLLHTAAHAKVNIFTYFNALQQHTESVQHTPEKWLPWNYQQTLTTLKNSTVKVTTTAASI